MTNAVFSLWYNKEHQENKNVIYQFKDDHLFLSNFYPCKIILPGEVFHLNKSEIIIPDLEYSSTEKAYMAWKSCSLEQRIKIQNLSSGDAKKFAHNEDEKDPFLLRPDYSDENRLKIMQLLIEQKFSNQNPELLEMLLLTKDDLLVEGNTWHDTFFGFDLIEGHGQNNLGRIQMNVRKLRRKELEI
jgi:predicted NAD-dependent protein-ADP-ribosyltransferase YbiA (DUF1768 family)